MDSLANRLAKRAGTTAFSGALKSGPTKFRVLPADPDAAKKPRTAKGPGHYTLSEGAVLVVSRRPIGERIVNEASMQFYAPDTGKSLPGVEPYPLKLADGYDTWAAGWVRGEKVLWVFEKGAVRSYDITNPAQVKEASFGAAELEKVPKPILDAMRAAIEVPPAAAPDVGPPAATSK
jgi:hypothetical protein